jgi:hypothetical protein
MNLPSYMVLSPQRGEKGSGITCPPAGHPAGGRYPHTPLRGCAPKNSAALLCCLTIVASCRRDVKFLGIILVLATTAVGRGRGETPDRLHEEHHEGNKGIGRADSVFRSFVLLQKVYYHGRGKMSRIFWNKCSHFLEEDFCLMCGKMFDEVFD